jgi:hypothetical protein
MSGWLRHLALKAQVQAGFSPQIVVWSLIATIATAAMFCFLSLGAFLWLSERYDPVVASLVLGGFFFLIAMIALAGCAMARRRNIERARLELAARDSAPGAGWVDPRLLATGFQIGQSIGWRRLASLAAVGLLAAGLAKEWFGRDDARPEGDDAPES